MNAIDVIKSTRFFEKNGKINIDYRVTPMYREAKDRFRFSTGIEYSKRNLRYLGQKASSLAFDHFMSQRSPDGDNLLQDIALTALNETRNSRRETTQQDYLNIYRNSIEGFFGKMRLKDIRPTDVNKWANEIIALGISGSRYKKYQTTMNMIMNYAYMNEYIDRNPMDLVVKKANSFKQSPDRTKKYYTEEEVGLLISNSTGWFKAMLTTLFYSGMRTGEAMALKWSDLDFDKDKITIRRSQTNGVTSETTKTGIINSIDMSIVIKVALKKLYEERISDEWIFPSSRTKKPFYQAKAITERHLKPLIKKLGIEYKTLHATRHTFASILAKKNAPMVYVQRMLGHKKLSTTMDFYVKNGLLEDDGKNDILDRLYA